MQGGRCKVMANFQFIISPPMKKPAPRKVEKVVEEIPKLILAPFNPVPEVRFGDVIINAKATRNLIIYNPSTTVAFSACFGSIESDDRIFINESEVKLLPREEKQIIITWGPIRSGYLRKIIRVYDMTKKARSFDVVLRGMAINSNPAENMKRKKMNSMQEKRNLDEAITLSKLTNQNRNEILHTIRRQTYTIEEKENQLPNNFQSSKNTFDACFSTYQKDVGSLNTLSENSAVTNFSIQSFQSYDSVDAPVKYSNFESELALNARTSDEINSSLFRRSTLSMNFKEELEDEINLSPSKTDDYFSDCADILSPNIKYETENDMSTPQNDCFSCSLDLNYPEAKSGNVTFELENFEKSICLTPQKNVNLDSFIMSPASKLAELPRSISKSTNYLLNIDKSVNMDSSFKSYKRDDLFFISPPTKSCKRSRRSPEENFFLHRTGSSAISDRKKHLRTSFMSRKKSPNSAVKTRGPRRISSFSMENTIEKVRTRNPQTFKQTVTSHCYIDDPFIKQVLYNDDKWAERQEKDIIKWLNSVLVPPVELNDENCDWTVDAADVWLKNCRLDDSSTISIGNKVPPLYSMPQTLDILRKRRRSLINSEPVKSVFKKLSTTIEKKIISVRDDRDLQADEGLKTKLFQLLASYDPQWLRMGLEAIYDKEIALQRKADVGGLGVFIRKNLLNIPVNKKNGNYKEVVKKYILFTFLKLVFFMDQARMQRLIRHNPCLFILKSKYKSSQDLLSAFCADLVIGRGYVMKHLKAIAYTLQFKQTCIDEYNYTIKSLDCLKDGVRLTRLCEILFMESDLCSKLRVPAIDIENKKHNVEIAMKAAKSRCHIEGNISAEDIVLGNRAGSRMKTLSFLWQIINNYLTPLFEKAVVKIQRWWRNRRLRYCIRNFIFRKKTDSAVVIQSAWRNYMTRKQSAIKIQRWYRARSTVEIERSRYLALKSAASLIQIRYRAKKAMLTHRCQFLTFRRSAILIQQKFRALRAMKLERKRYLDILKATVFVQQKFKATQCAKQERRKYLDLKAAAVFIQHKFRANRDMIIHRDWFLSLKTSAVVIQRRFRTFRTMQLERQRYLKIVKTIIFIQRKFIANQIAKTERIQYLELKHAAVLLQQKFRANREMKIHRNQFKVLRNSVIIIQRRFRALRIMKIQRNQYITMLKLVSFVQRKFRANRIAKSERSLYLALKNTTVLVQQMFRANKAGNIQRQRYMTLKNSAIIIQQKFRALKAMKLERQRYLSTQKAVLLIQREFRAYQLLKLERSRYLTLKSAAVFIQQKFRANRDTKAQKHWYTTIKTSTVFIQRKFKAYQAMKIERNRYLNLLKAVVFVQQKFRCNCLAKLERSRYQQLKKAVTTVQRRYRLAILLKKTHSDFLKLKNAAITIQQNYRAMKLMQHERKKFKKLQTAVVTTQRKFRAQRAMRACRSSYLKLKLVTIKVQQRFKALERIKASKMFGQSRCSLRASDIVKFNAFGLRIVDQVDVQQESFAKMITNRVEFLVLKMTTVFIQRRFRMKICRRHFLNLKASIIRIQQWWRVILSNRLDLEQIKETPPPSLEELAAVKIQALWRGYIHRKGNPLPRNSSTCMRKDNKENPDSKITLGERYKKAIYQMKTSDLYNVITIALWNLETVTTFSAKLCEGVAQEDIVPIIFSIVSRGNRSEPSLELYRAGFSIFINLARYLPTRLILWNSMDKTEDVKQILRIMNMTCDKFLRKIDIEVFRNSATLLWLLCQDISISKHLANVEMVHQHIKKMFDILSKKCSCNKNVKNIKSSRANRINNILPKTEADWYADTETRTFNDNCLAIKSIYISLFKE